LEGFAKKVWGVGDVLGLCGVGHNGDFDGAALGDLEGARNGDFVGRNVVG